MMSACGVLCSKCPAYHAKTKGIAHQKRTVEAWHRIYRLNEKPEHISCYGCLGLDEEVFHTCRRCKARCCCRSKGFASCAECPKELCTYLEKAQSVWDKVPNLINKLTPKDFNIYALPYCGHRERLTAVRASLRDQK
jgi:hypothetical protein